MNFNKNLGPVTSYGYAVAHGYTGTEEQWAQNQADVGKNADAAKASADKAYQSEQAAKASQDKAKTSETNAKTSETEAAKQPALAKTEADRAKQEADRAKEEADRAASQADAGKISMEAAGVSASAAKTSETNALQYKNDALTHSNSSKDEADRAKAEADKASNSETAAKQSETNAKQSETKSQKNISLATAQADRAKNEADRAKNIVDRAVVDTTPSPAILQTQTKANCNFECSSSSVFDITKIYGITKLESSQHERYPPAVLSAFQTPDTKIIVKGKNLLDKIEDPVSHEKIKSRIALHPGEKICIGIKVGSEPIHVFINFYKGKNMEDFAASDYLVTSDQKSGWYSVLIQNQSTANITYTGCSIDCTYQESKRTIEKICAFMNVDHIDEKDYDNSFVSQEYSVNIPFVLNGLKMNSNPSYVTQDNQGWVCDYIDLESKQHIKKIAEAKKLTWDDTLSEKYKSNTMHVYHCNNLEIQNGSTVLCNHYRWIDPDRDNGPGIFSDSGTDLCVRATEEFGLTLDAFTKEWNRREPRVFYVSTAQTSEPITQEVVDAFKNIHSLYPTSNIFNDEATAMKIRCTLDTKCYIDNTDKQLLQNNRAADAKVVGQQIDSIYNDTFEGFSASGKNVSCYPKDKSKLHVVSDFSFLRAGKGEPSSDNLMNISGRNTLEVHREGKNLLNFVGYSGGYCYDAFYDGKEFVYTSDGTKDYSRLTSRKENLTYHNPGTYTFSISKPLLDDILIKMEDENDQTISVVIPIGETSKTFTVTEDQKIKKSSIELRYINDPAKEIRFMAQVEKGDQPTEFETYRNDTFTTEFFEEVTGGQYDWDTNILKKQWTNIKVLKGTEDEKWKFDGITGPKSLPLHNFTVDEPLNEDSSLEFLIASNAYKCLKKDAIKEDMSIYVTHNKEINFIDSRYHTEEAWRQHLKDMYAAGTPILLCWRTNDKEIQFNQPKVIEGIFGVNNFHTLNGNIQVTGYIDSIKNIKQINKLASDAFDLADTKTSVDDNIISVEKTWSSNKILDKFCNSNNTISPFATIKVDETTSMHVISEITPKQEGYGYPSPDWIMPITKSTEATLKHIGKNMVNLKSYTDTGRHFLGAASEQERPNIYFEPGKKYTISFREPFNIDMDIGFYGSTIGMLGTLKKGETSLTYLVEQYGVKGWGCIFTDSFPPESKSNVWQIEEGPVATSYEPYIEKEYKAQFDQGLYGCKYDWMTGVAKNTWKEMILTGDEHWVSVGVGSIHGFELSGEDAPKLVDDRNNPVVMSNSYRATTIDNMTNYSVFSHYGNLIVAHEGIHGSDWNAHLKDLYEANTPVILCYKTAEPQNIKVGTPQEIYANAGTNSMYSYPDNVSVTYFSDFKKEFNGVKQLASDAFDIANSKASIVDNGISPSKTYSSKKINELMAEKAEIDDTTAAPDKVYSSTKVEKLLAGKQDKEGKFELIEEGTTKGVDAVFVRDAEPDGTPYNFTAVRLLMNCATGIEHSQNLYFDGKNGAINRNIWTSGDKEIMMTTIIVNGTILNQNLCSKEIDTNFIQSPVGYSSMYTKPASNITKVRSYLGIKEGTYFRIEAVRAK